MANGRVYQVRKEKKIVPIKDQIRTVSLPAEEFPEWPLMSARIQN